MYKSIPPLSRNLRQTLLDETPRMLFVLYIKYVTKPSSTNWQWSTEDPAAWSDWDYSNSPWQDASKSQVTLGRLLQSFATVVTLYTITNINSSQALTEFNVVCKVGAISLMWVKCSGVCLKRKLTETLKWESQKLLHCINFLVSFLLTFCDINCISITHAWLWNRN